MQWESKSGGGGRVRQLTADLIHYSSAHPQSNLRVALPHFLTTWANGMRGCIWTLANLITAEHTCKAVTCCRSFDKKKRKTQTGYTFFSLLNSFPRHFSNNRQHCSAVRGLFVMHGTPHTHCGPEEQADEDTSCCFHLSQEPCQNSWWMQMFTRFPLFSTFTSLIFKDWLCADCLRHVDRWIINGFSCWPPGKCGSN